MTSEEEARALLDAGDVSEYFLVPADFRSSGAVTRVQPESGPGASLSQLESQESSGDLVAYLLREAMLREAGVTTETAARILQGVSITTVTTAGQEVSGLDIAAGIAVPIVFVGLFMISIFITSGYLLQSVTEEKENRVVEIVLSSIPSVPLMAGKILGLGGAGLTQVAVWVLTALVALPLLSSQIPDLSGIEIDPVILGLALIYFVLGYLAYGAIFAAIGAIAPGNREAQQYSGFLGFFAAIPFILFSLVLTDPGSMVVTALALFPLTAPTTMLLVLGISEQIPWPLVGASLMSLTLFALLADVGVGAHLPGDRAALRRAPQPQPTHRRQCVHRTGVASARAAGISAAAEPAHRADSDRPHASGHGVDRDSTRTGVTSQCARHAVPRAGSTR